MVRHQDPQRNRHGDSAKDAGLRLTICWHERVSLTDRDENGIRAGTDIQTARRSVPESEGRIDNPPQDAILHHKGRNTRTSKGDFENAPQRRLR
jgi:hypothetical protein